VYLLVPRWLHGASRFVSAYDAGIITLLWHFWTHALRSDPRETKARAALDDPGKNVVYLIVFATAIVGLIAAVGILAHGPKVANETEKWIAYALGTAAIAGGWMLMHTIYTFRYAHLYWYDDDGDGTACGGIHFPETDEPSDWDFAYFAFCIGTSFAVSDPQVTETRVRREVITHSIISFAYNSVIIGMVINLFAGIFAAASGTDAGASK
jgi:uncharacterized membrane protein